MRMYDRKLSIISFYLPGLSIYQIRYHIYWLLRKPFTMAKVMIFENDWWYWQTFSSEAKNVRNIWPRSSHNNEEQKIENKPSKYCFDQLPVCKNCSFKRLSLMDEVNIRNCPFYHPNAVTLILKLHVLSNELLFPTVTHT